MRNAKRSERERVWKWKVRKSGYKKETQRDAKWKEKKTKQECRSVMSS